MGSYTLPSGYTNLAYIRFTGEQYFDAGFIPAYSTGYDVTFELEPNEAGWPGVFGLRTSSSSVRFDIEIGYGGYNATWRANSVLRYGYGTYGDCDCGHSLVGKMLHVSKNNLNFEFDEDDVPRGIKAFSGTFTPAYNLYVGAINTANVAGNFFYGKMYRATFNGIADFIPAKRNSDDAIGFYDTIRETFYTSATETPFVAGPVFNPGDEVIMTQKSNPEVLAICYAQGWCAHEDYMTRAEAEAVTTFPAKLFENSSVTSFDEFRYFTGLYSSGIAPGGSGQLFYYAQQLMSVTFPEQLNGTRGYAFRYAFRNSSHPLRKIIINGACESIGSDSFYQWTDGEVNQGTCKTYIICKAITPPTLSSTRNGSIAIVHLYVPDDSIEAYQNDSMWGQAREILPISQCPESFFKPMVKPMEEYRRRRRQVMMPEQPDYIKDGLVFWLDGEIGNYPNKWVDQITGATFVNHGSTFIGNGRRFDGVDDYLTCDLTNSLIPSSGTSTIEVCVKLQSDVSTKSGVVFFPGGDTKRAFGWSSQGNYTYSNIAAQTTSTIWAPAKSLLTLNERVTVSTCGNMARGARNGVLVARDGYGNGFTNASSAIYKLSDGLAYIGGFPGRTNSFLHGVIYSIRVYNKNISEAEMKHNHAVDMQRFIHVKKYIHFEDPEFEDMCMKFSTDGKGLTMDNLAAVTNSQLAGTFNGNNFSTNLIARLNTFNEFQYFTGLTQLSNVGEFSNMYSMSSIIIPPNITSFGSQNFRCTYAYNITTNFTIKILRTAGVISIGALTFGNRASSSYTFTILVPNALVESYKAANYWKNFANNIQGY